MTSWRILAISRSVLRVRIGWAVGVRAVVVFAVFVFMSDEDIGFCQCEVSERGLSGCDGDFFCEGLQRVGRDGGMKDLQLIAAGGDIFHADVTMGVGNSVIRRRHSDDDGIHLRMNVAEDERNPRLVELYKARSAAFVETKVKALALEERKDVVEERIVVGELDFASDRNHDEAGVKFLVSLHEGRNVRRILLNALDLGSQRIQPNDRLRCIFEVMSLSSEFYVSVQRFLCSG